MPDDQSAPIKHPDPDFIVKPFFHDGAGIEFCIGMLPGAKPSLYARGPDGRWVFQFGVELGPTVGVLETALDVFDLDPSVNPPALLYWARDAIEQLEDGIHSYVGPSRYRQWFRAREYDAVCALGLRIALGMEIPEDMQDIAAALVNARLDEEEAKSNAESDPEPRIGGVVFILAQDGRFLMEKRDDIGNFPPGLFFPAGKVETDETPRHALARELLEELHVVARDPSPMDLVDRYVGLDVTDNQYKMLPYLISTWVRSDGAHQRPPSFTDKGHATAWVTWERAIDNCCPPVRTMAREAARLMGWSK